ncbi:MAG TPA: HAMP domain-containing methyl-accepting chemotaxis protein [Symbiobacteriaceae bacterium]|jgi:methyl-accepting chemotaxis protein|nr:HAMP domain-containing methyl-accepting chemotaxis protein [Symbiobacteriaceae bacterium]
MRIFNPLQWNFRFRTVATLLTWAVVPLVLGGFVAWRSLVSASGPAGVSAAQLETLTGIMFRNLLLMTVPLLLICLGAALLFSWVVLQPLVRLQRGVEEVARGNLAQEPLPVASRDEVGRMTQAFNAMLTALQSMVRTLANTAVDLDAAGSRLREAAGQSMAATESSVSQVEQVRGIAVEQAAQAASGAQATAELRDAAEQVAVSADAQAREVERVAETVQQVAASIQQVAAGASVVAEAAANTHSAAEAGGKAVHAVVSGMAQVQERVLAASAQVQDLTGSLKHVDEILQLISEIADQTDLLALNAAIEAARVGEQGRGFAVVAGEVRRLAERSRRAAGDITSQVQGLRAGAQAVVVAMEAGTQEVRNGTALAGEAGQSLQRILTAVVETQAQVESISAAAEEIAAASSQVVDTTQHLSAIAEENAGTAEQMLIAAGRVADLIGAVEHGAQSAECASGAMAAAAEQMRGSVADASACAGEVSDTATRLREQVARFRL